MQTLKEKYKSRNPVHEKSLQKIFESKKSKRSKANVSVALLEEKKDHNNLLLLEALKDYDQVTNAVQSLQAFKNSLGGSTPSITAAIDNAAKEINKYSGGNFLERIKDKAKAGDLFKTNPLKNPIVAGLKLVDILKSGFSQIPDILSNNLGEELLKNNPNSTIEAIIPDDNKNIVDLITKSFQPAGLFKSIPFALDAKTLTADVIDGVKISDILKLKQVADGTEKVTDPAVIQQTEPENSKEKTSQSSEQQKIAVVAAQKAAKEAGISEADTIERFLNVVGLEGGSKNPNASIAIQSLKDKALAAKVAPGQLDGFVDGISIDKNQFIKLINKAIETKIKADQAESEKKGAAVPGAVTK